MEILIYLVCFNEKVLYLECSVSCLKRRKSNSPRSLYMFFCVICLLEGWNRRFFNCKSLICSNIHLTLGAEIHLIFIVHYLWVMAPVCCMLFSVLLLKCLYLVDYRFLTTEESMMKVHGKSTKKGNMDFPWTFSSFSLKITKFEAYLFA